MPGAMAAPVAHFACGAVVSAPDPGARARLQDLQTLCTPCRRLRRRRRYGSIEMKSPISMPPTIGQPCVRPL